jgi:hypothetical protein
MQQVDALNHLVSESPSEVQQLTGLMGCSG